MSVEKFHFSFENTFFINYDNKNKTFDKVLATKIKTLNGLLIIHEICFLWEIIGSILCASLVTQICFRKEYLFISKKIIEEKKLRSWWPKYKKRIEIFGILAKINNKKLRQRTTTYRLFFSITVNKK